MAGGQSRSRGRRAGGQGRRVRRRGTWRRGRPSSIHALAAPRSGASHSSSLQSPAGSGAFGTAPAVDCTDELRDAPDRRAASAWIEDGPTAPPGASPPHSAAPAASAPATAPTFTSPTTAAPGGARGWTGTQATPQWHGTGAPGDEDSDVESLAHDIQISAPRCQIRQGSPKRQIGGSARVLAARRCHLA